MRKFLAAPFEALHVLGTAFFFGLAFLVTFLTAPNWLAAVAPMSPDSAARHFNQLTSLLGRNGLWIALAALVCGAIAPYARADGKKTLAWIRVACAAAAAVIVLLTWGDFESLPSTLKDDAKRPVAPSSWRSDKRPTPWNGLLLATGLNLVLGAFQISGGAAKKAKSGGDGGK